MSRTNIFFVLVLITFGACFVLGFYLSHTVYCIRSHTLGKSNVTRNESRIAVYKLNINHNTSRSNVSTNFTNCPSGTPGLVGLRDVLRMMPPGDVLFSYGDRDYLPHHLHWVCNTAGWPGVHERTLIVVSDQFSRDAINRLSHNVSTYSSPAKSRHHGFYSKGYRKLTIKRVEILVEVLKSGRGVVMFEGDALWTSNILADPHVGGANRTHDVAFYRDGSDGSILGAGISCFLCSEFFLLLC